MIYIKYHKNPALFFIILVLTGSSVASLDIQNYDHDPDLAAALEYDRGETTDQSKADRELAEKYYLEYLKKDIPSFQKARVYLRLGTLYTVGSNPKKGIMPDDKKGDMYLAKVLELEPERIDTATIRARTLLSSSPLLSSKESLQKRLDVYEWLSSLNEEKFQKLWLPLEPDQKAVLPITLKSLQNLVPNVRYTTAVNAVTTAAHMPDRKARLAEIIGRFPDTEIAGMARQQLKSQLEKVADEMAKNLISANDEPHNARNREDGATPMSLESQAGGMTQEESTPPEKSSAQRSDAVSVLADIPPIEGGTHRAWTVHPLIICAVLAGSLLFYIAWHGWSISLTIAALALTMTVMNCSREPPGGGRGFGRFEAWIFEQYVLKPIPESVTDLRVDEPETMWDIRHNYVMRFKISKADVTRILESRAFEEFKSVRYANDGNLYWGDTHKVEFDPNTNGYTVIDRSGNLPLYTGPHDEPPEWFVPNEWDNPKIYKFEEKWGKAHRNQVKVLIFNEALEEAYFVEYL